MGVFLIFVVILISSLILIGLSIYGDNFVSWEDASENSFKDFVRAYSEEMLTIGVILLIAAIIAMSISGIVAGVMSDSTEPNIQYAEEYDELMSKMETDKDNLAYKLRVEKYNNRIDKAKQDLDNYWIGWYVDRSLLSLPKIKIK